MIISRLKDFLAFGLNSTVDLDRIIRRRCDRYILSYHRVLPKAQADDEGVHHSLWISPETLSSQIEWMLNIGKVVDYSQIMDFTISNDRPLFALTFDDGWMDNYTYGLPILKHFNVPATIFLATEAIDSGFIFWPQDIATKTQHLLSEGGVESVTAAIRNSLPEKRLSAWPGPSEIMQLVESWIEALKLVSDTEREQRISAFYRYLGLSKTPLSGFIMGWGELREMQKYNISFGSHTHRHTILKGGSQKLIEYELIKSRDLINEKLQTEVDSFCYPNGRYSGKEGVILARCGYRYGFRLDNTSLQHSIDVFYIPRFLVSERKATNPTFFKLCLLEAPFYKSVPHNPNIEDV